MASYQVRFGYIASRKVGWYGCYEAEEETTVIGRKLYPHNEIVVGANSNYQQIKRPHTMMLDHTSRSQHRWHL